RQVVGGAHGERETTLGILEAVEMGDYVVRPHLEVRKAKAPLLIRRGLGEHVGQRLPGSDHHAWHHRTLRVGNAAADARGAHRLLRGGVPSGAGGGERDGEGRRDGRGRPARRVHRRTSTWITDAAPLPLVQPTIVASPATATTG